MGFFGELKQDLSQAVNELMPGDESNTEIAGQDEGSVEERTEDIGYAGLSNEEADAVEETMASDAAEQAAVSDVLEQTVASDVTEQTVVSDVTEQNEVSNDTYAAGEETAGGLSDNDIIDLDSMLEDVLVEENVQDGDIPKAAESETELIVNENKGDKNIMDTFSEEREFSDETSVITMGMTINGDISSEGSVDIIGNINGNIDICGKLNVTGHINGNSKAAEVYADGAKINGEIVSDGAVKIGASTVIIGNITAASAAIAGAVKGDIDVRGPVTLDASAIVMGNIKSKSVQINNGAVIEGMCSQCYADVSPTAFFEDYKPEIKKAKASK